MSSSRPPVHVVEEPEPGQVVRLPVGSRLALRFRPRLKGGGWEVAGRPDNLVPLAGDGHELTFLVFSGSGPAYEAPLRLVRRRDARPEEVRELRVVCAG